MLSAMHYGEVLVCVVNIARLVGCQQRYYDSDNACMNLTISNNCCQIVPQSLALCLNVFFSRKHTAHLLCSSLDRRQAAGDVVC